MEVSIFSYFYIRTTYVFKYKKKPHHFQTLQHLFSNPRQNLLKNKVCFGREVLGRLMQKKIGLYLQVYLLVFSMMSFVVQNEYVCEVSSLYILHIYVISFNLTLFQRRVHHGCYRYICQAATSGNTQ